MKYFDHIPILEIKRMRSVLDRSSCCVVSTVRDRLGLSLVVCLSLTSSAPVPPPPFHPQLPKLFCLQLSFRERFCRLEVEGPCLMNIFLFTFMAGEWDDWFQTSNAMSNEEKDIPWKIIETMILFETMMMMMTFLHCN